jgi:hypothetical protein
MARAACAQRRAVGPLRFEGARCHDPFAGGNGSSMAHHRHDVTMSARPRVPDEEFVRPAFCRPDRIEGRAGNHGLPAQPRVSTAQAVRIFKTMAPNSIRVMTDNPYRLPPGTRRTREVQSPCAVNISMAERTGLRSQTERQCHGPISRRRQQSRILHRGRAWSSEF